jgi:hypothetical protein
MAMMIYGRGSDDVGKFSFVPKLPYLSPYKIDLFAGPLPHLSL